MHAKIANQHEEVIFYSCVFAQIHGSSALSAAISSRKARQSGGPLNKSFVNLLYRGYAGAEAGFIPRAGVLVDDALFHGFIDHGYGSAEGFICRLGVACSQGLTQLAQCCAQTGGVGAVVFRAFGGLARALQRRKMICHCDCMGPIKKSFFGGSSRRCYFTWV